jgi:hypothetical protein
MSETPFISNERVSEMTPEARHARLVGEIKRRLSEWPKASQPGCRCSPGCRGMSERPLELAALLEIAERHEPISTPGPAVGLCPECCVEWPCPTWMSIEKILGPGAGQV